MLAFALVATTLLSMALTYPTSGPKGYKGISSDLRIIGGEFAAPGEFPYIASLEIIFDDGVGLCGGTIINKQVIVTAAHCVVDPTSGDQVAASSIHVGVGSNDRSKQKYGQAVRVVTNPSYDPETGKNDIAVVMVPPLPINNKTISAIPIYRGKLPVNATLTALGWGRTANDQFVDTTSVLLKKAKIKIGLKKDCQEYIDGYMSSNGPQICTENSLAPGNDTCQGDSGTGAVINKGGSYYLAGLTSYGSSLSGDPACALNDGFSVYTHVNYYISFISNATGIPDSAFYVDYATYKLPL
ncbi:trypsin-like serine protease [Martensiomyces pterosporus]|nr:trypsin-like serine protease [Martensiomyces pterosporus]